MRSLARHDEATALYYAREEGMGIGMEKGIGIGMEKGRMEGKAEGKMEGKMEAARNLKALGIPTDIIVKSIGLPPEEIAKL